MVIWMLQTNTVARHLCLLWCNISVMYVQYTDHFEPCFVSCRVTRRWEHQIHYTNLTDGILDLEVFSLEKINENKIEKKIRVIVINGHFFSLFFLFIFEASHCACTRSTLTSWFMKYFVNNVSLLFYCLNVYFDSFRCGENWKRLAEKHRGTVDMRLDRCHQGHLKKNSNWILKWKWDVIFAIHRKHEHWHRFHCFCMMIQWTLLWPIIRFNMYKSNM